MHRDSIPGEGGYGCGCRRLPHISTRDISFAAAVPATTHAQRAHARAAGVTHHAVSRRYVDCMMQPQQQGPSLPCSPRWRHVKDSRVAWSHSVLTLY
jgi:hypothetical protein